MSSAAGQSTSKGAANPQPGAWGGAKRLPVNEVRDYWFQQDPTDATKLRLVGWPGYPVVPDDPKYWPDALRVVTDCIVNVYLYNMPNKQFDIAKGGIVFNPGTDWQNYYTNFSFMTGTDGRTYAASFHAKYRRVAQTVMDSFDIMLKDFAPPQGTQTVSSSHKFDPGMCNPGDDPGQG